YYQTLLIGRKELPWAPDRRMGVEMTLLRALAFHPRMPLPEPEIVMRTGTVDNGILALIRHTRGNEVLFIPVLFVLFSLGGAVFG
ncbi:hypothetical protein MJI20_31205, partial [Salmonella enterica subsp. enterica serovar Anatum]|nr:hypothetical protein [Salmonella enterica subsp. enterica serovar Anatum]